MDAEEQSWGNLQLFYNEGGAEDQDVFVPLSGAQLWIGKSEDCDIVLRHPSILPKHFKLTPLFIPQSSTQLAVLTDYSRAHVAVIGSRAPPTNAPRRSEAPRSIVLGSGDTIMVPAEPADAGWPPLRITYWSVGDYGTLTPLVRTEGLEAIDTSAVGSVDAATSDSVSTNEEQVEGSIPEGFSIPIAQSDFDAELQCVMGTRLGHGSSARVPTNSQGGNSSTDSQQTASGLSRGDSPAADGNGASDQPNGVDRLSELENFLEQVVEVHTCSICMELLYDPVASTNCMHLFCGGCLSRWMFRTSGSRTDCPKCRTRIEVVMPTREWAHLYNFAARLRPSGDRTDEERARMDEANSFRGHRRFVVEDRVNEELMADMERIADIAMSFDDAASAIVATTSTASTSRSRTRNNRDVIVLNTSPFVRTPSPTVARPRHRNLARQLALQHDTSRRRR